MNSISDTHLRRVRLRFLDLLKSFFIQEPDAERLSRWRGTFAALAKEQVSISLDQAIIDIVKLLAQRSLESIREEFYQLFINPYGDGIIETTLSAYVDGHNYGASLAEIRGFLQVAQIAKKRSIVETEDSLVLMLDLLATLIEEEHGEQSRHHQDELLTNFLLPFANQFNKTLKEDKRADFYAACSAFLLAYLELETGLITEVPHQ